MKDDDTGFARRRMDLSKQPFEGQQPYAMPADLVVPGAIDLDAIEEWEWVPQGEGVTFRPLLMNVTHGYFISLLRVRRAGVLSRHRHAGPVHAVTLKGRWRYLEHDWEATPLSYVFEPPGETHTLVVPEDVEEMITFFNVTGGYVYVDTKGEALGYEDVYTKIEAARAHYEAMGKGADMIDRYIR